MDFTFSKKDVVLRFIHVLERTALRYFLWLCSIILCGQPELIGSVFGSCGQLLVLDSWRELL